MRKYHFDINIDKKRGNNAGSKATSDCKNILINMGFTDLQISLRQVWYLLPFNVLTLFACLFYYSVIIRKNSFIVVQYPLLGINHFFKYFIKLVEHKHCKFCAVIHDLTP